MNPIDLTDDEKRILIERLNAGQEPPEKLAKKLFPSLFAGLKPKDICEAIAKVRGRR